MTKTPVLLLTGYLGSGKTTLLNRILTNKKGIKFAVIVNDIGEVNIDATLIQKGGVVAEQDQNLVALQNGCICCTLKTDLMEQLHDIMAQKRFDYIVIEASGVCEPAPIAQTICSMPSYMPQYVKDGVAEIDCIATVVDAMRMRDEFGSGEALQNPNLDEEDIENLLIQQIEFCSMILLNKAADVTPEELQHIKDIIRAIQPVAPILECNYGDVDLDRIINTGLFDFDKVASSPAWLQAMEEENEDEHEHHHHDDDDEHENENENEDEDEEHHHHHHHHHEEGEAEEYGIGTWVYYQRRPFNLGLFDNFVAKHWPKGIIRAKGICYFADEEDTCYVFEQAGRQFQLKNAGQWYATMSTDELMDLMEREPQVRRDWDDRYGDRMQKLVFIGQHLDKETLKKQLDACLD